MNPFFAGLLTCFGIKLIQSFTETPLGKKTVAETKKIAKAVYEKVVPQKTQDQISMAMLTMEYLYNVGGGAYEVYRLFDALINNSGEVVFEFLIGRDTVTLMVNGEAVSKIKYEGELDYVKAGGIDLPEREDDPIDDPETEGTFELPEEWTFSTWSYVSLLEPKNKELVDSIEGLMALCLYYTLYNNFLGLELPKSVKFLIKCEEVNIGTIPSFILWKKYRDALDEVVGLYGPESVYVPEFIFENNCAPSWKVLKPESMEVIGQN